MQGLGEAQSSVTQRVAKFCFLAFHPESSLFGFVSYMDGVAINAEEYDLGFIMTNDVKMPAAPKKAN